MFPIHLFIIAFFMSIWDRFTIRDDSVRFNSQACVVIVSGKTGSGKSFSAINEMLRFKKRFKNGKIFSNMSSKLVDFPLTLDCFYSINDVPYLIVVDEANSVYGAKMKSDVPDELKKTLYQIRKGVGKRVVLLTQDYSLLDANFRKLAHYVYETKTYFGRLTSYRRFEQTVYETNSQVGGLDLKKVGKQPSRVSLWILQTRRIRSLYDFKALVDVEWHKKQGSEKGVPAESL